VAQWAGEVRRAVEASDRARGGATGQGQYRWGAGAGKAGAGRSGQGQYRGGAGAGGARAPAPTTSPAAPSAPATPPPAPFPPLIFHAPAIAAAMASVPPSDIIAAVARGFAHYSAGRVSVPPPQTMGQPPLAVFSGHPDGQACVKSGYIHGSDTFVTKVSTYMNRRRVTPDDGPAPPRGILGAFGRASMRQERICARQRHIRN
jgi:hypothetical protein